MRAPKLPELVAIVGIVSAGVGWYEALREKPPDPALEAYRYVVERTAEQLQSCMEKLD